MSVFELFPLPQGLHPEFVAWLHRRVAEIAPRNAYETLLVGRMAQAYCRIHLAATMPSAGSLDPAWIRYQNAADRLLRWSEKELAKYRKANPVVPASTPAPAPKPEPTPAPVFTWPTTVRTDGAWLPPITPHRGVDRASDN
jgi:hypothetical protein